MIRQFGWSEFAFLVEAARWTVLLSLIAFAGGGALGLVVALARISRVRAVAALATGWIGIVQGTPLLIVLFGFYFGLDIAGLRVPAIIAAALGLSVYASAFLGEIWRGCLLAVPQGQWEAASALGLSRLRTLWLVVAPQAFRLAIPPTIGFAVQIVKNTSLAAIIGFVELSRAGQMVNNATFQPFKVFAAVALIYFVLCFPLSRLSRRLEVGLGAGRVALETP